jgi:hypothetical protein
MGSGGIVAADVETKSPDGRARLTIPKGTRFLNKDGWPSSFVSMVAMPAEQQPPAPADARIIGLVYDLGPAGATFNPPANLTFIYEDSYVPSGINEKDLVIAYWDASGNKWVTLDTVNVDTVNNTITAKVSHFTAFAILSAGSPTPAPTTTPTATPMPTPTGTPTPIETTVPAPAETTTSTPTPAGVTTTMEPPTATNNAPSDNTPVFRMNLLVLIIGVAAFLIAMTATFILVRRRNLIKIEGGF